MPISTIHVFQWCCGCQFY